MSKEDAFRIDNSNVLCGIVGEFDLALVMSLEIPNFYSYLFCNPIHHLYSGSLKNFLIIFVDVACLVLTFLITR